MEGYLSEYLQAKQRDNPSYEIGAWYDWCHTGPDVTCHYDWMARRQPFGDDGDAVATAVTLDAQEVESTVESNPDGLRHLCAVDDY